MLLNCKGFSLVEVLGSFSILLLVISFMVPLLIKINQEQTIIEYKREALKILHTEKEAFLYDDSSLQSKLLVSGNRQFGFTAQLNGDLVQMCVTWEVPWSEYGQTCTHVKL